MIVIYLLAIYGLTFLIRDSDGPWGIMSWIRNKLVSNQYVGVFFFKLLTCPFCTGCHAGWILYLISDYGIGYKVNLIIIWILTGGAVSLILDALMTFLHNAASSPE